MKKLSFLQMLLFTVALAIGGFSVAGSVYQTAPAEQGSGSGFDADTVDGLEGASFLQASAYTAADVLAKTKTVDGAGSGLDADTVDGVSSSGFVQTAGPQTIVSGGDALSTRGNATDITNTAWLSVDRSDNSRVGYVGDGSAINDDMYFVADLGNVRINAPLGSVILTATDLTINGYTAHHAGNSSRVQSCAPTVDLPSIGAGSTTIVYPACSVAQVGDACFVSATQAISYNYDIQCKVTVAGNVDLWVRNESTASINPPSVQYYFMVVR